MWLSERLPTFDVDRTTSSTAQKLATAVLYICQMPEYWMGRTVNLLGQDCISTILVFQISTFGFQSEALISDRG